MGIIQNGFLIGAKKSAGGITFARVKGQQTFRNKSQVSANYVPTAAQNLQRSLQASVTTAVRSSRVLLELALSGWNRHPLKRTNENEFIREAVRLFTREGDSSLSLISEKESRMVAAETAGYDTYLIQAMAEGRMPLTKSNFAFPWEAVSVSGGVLSFNEAGVESVKQFLGMKYTQDYVNSVPFRLVVLSSPGSIDVVSAPYTPADPDLVVSVAIAAPRVRNGVVSGYLYSTAMVIDWNAVDPDAATLTSLTLNGTESIENASVTPQNGDTIVLTGANLNAGLITGYGTGMAQVNPLNAMLDITSSSATSITGTVLQPLGEAELNWLEQDGIRIWN